MSDRALLWLLVVVVMGLGGLGGLVLLGGGAEKGLAEPRDLAREPRESAAEVSPAEAEREVEPGPDAATQADPEEVELPPPEWRGTGSISLRVVAAASGAPVPELDFVVCSERPRAHLLLEGKTDADGRATLRGLPEDLLLIETARAPPYASGLKAVWLREGDFQEVELRVGGGGTVRGRVVDDIGTPLEGIEVLVNGHAGVPLFRSQAVTYDRTVVAHTDAQGRYQVPALISRPRGVWLVEGEQRAERLAEVGLSARRAANGLGVGTSFHLLEGQEKELEDLVLRRPGTVRGRLLDAHGQPIAGALVSLNADRWWISFGSQSVFDRLPSTMWSSPGEPDFELLSQEALTDVTGGFAVPIERQNSRTLVRTPAGLCELLPGFAPPAPGEDSEVQEIRMRVQSMLYLDLGDIAEQRHGNGWVPRLSARAERAADVLVTSLLRPDNLFEIHLARSLEQLGALELLCTNPFLDPSLGTAELELSGHRSGSVVQVSLKPTAPHSLHVRVTWPQPAAERSVLTVLTACLGDGAAFDSGTCCGLGGQQTTWLKGAPVDLTLRVRRPERYWVHATVGHGEELVKRSFGPFLPGPDRHLLELPDVLPSEGRQEEVAEEDGSKTPPEQRIPDLTDDQSRRRGQLRVALVDEREGAPVAARIRVESIPVTDEAPRRRTISAGRDGTAEADLAPGAWLLKVETDDYRPREPIPFQVYPDQETDLGALRLTPWPRIRARLTLPDGSPPARWQEVAILTEDARKLFEVSLPADGVLDLPVPDGVDPLRLLPVWVEVRREPYSLSFQRVRVDRWSAGHVVEVVLPGTTAVEVRFDGIPEAHRGTDIPLEVVPLLEPPAEELRSAEWGFDADSYRLALAPGRYQLRASGMLYASDPQVIRVGDEPLVVTLPVHPAY